MNVETNVEKIVAVLHDVLEDTALTLNNLESEGFGYDVLIPLGILTKGKGVSYDDYIKQIAENNVARNVIIIYINMLGINIIKFITEHKLNIVNVSDRQLVDIGGLVVIN